MLFNSYEYILAFLPITFFIYFYLNSKRLTQASKGWLVFTSLFFYSWWNIIYLPLILASILFNFVIGSSISKMIEESELKRKISAKSLLIIGVVSNIALLGYFKYTDFFITNSNVLLETQWELLHIVLPLGISFFTFTQIAYLVDVYRGEVKEMDYLNYTLFVTFFPHLLAGPILHHKEMMPQFDSLKSKVVNYRNLSGGLFLFSIGLFKKVIIADYFATVAGPGFDTAETLTLIEAWTTSLSYTLQLYFDFSGYTDMAIGTALLFNIKLPINFNSPYKALNIQDFWRRWHMTLSRFLRDYIYIALGGNRNGEARTYANLFIVFLIGGLWHGASWMFIIWGVLHGIAIVIHRVWQQMNFSMNKLLAWFITFNFINITWVFFRAKEWDDAIKVLGGMIGIHLISIKESQFFNTDTLWKIALALTITLAMKNSNQLLKIFKPSFPNAILISLILVYGILSLEEISEFLYFNF